MLKYELRFLIFEKLLSPPYASRPSFPLPPNLPTLHLKKKKKKENAHRRTDI